MKHYLNFRLALLLGASTVSKAQSSFTVSFSENEKVISRDKKNDQVFQFFLKAPIIRNTVSYSYTITVEPDLSSTNINQSEYKLDFKQQVATSQKPLGEMAFYVILKADSLPDRAREIRLKVKIVDEGHDVSAINKDQKELTLKIKAIETPKKDSLKTYSYLAYVGTNFDLVDGIKAKNLFFATNLFLPNNTPKGFKIGAYISLYGNRTFMATDSNGNVIRPSKIARSSDTTATYYYERANRTSSYVSDNLGAYFSPLVNLGCLSKKDNNLKIYYAPSMEFIWRRSHVTTSYSEKTPVDTIVKKEKIIGEVVPSDKFTVSFNQYQLNVGALGFFLTHETEDISIRLYCAVGRSTKYSPAVTSSQSFLDIPYRKIGDFFFSGRLWITEPVSGLTLQAEVTNTYNFPTPYYGVTLSKAIDFKNLGNVFNPIGR